jgi:hypothetical protein
MEFRISVEFQSCYGSDTMEGKQAMTSKGGRVYELELHEELFPSKR